MGAILAFDSIRSNAEPRRSAGVRPRRETVGEAMARRFGSADHGRSVRVWEDRAALLPSWFAGLVEIRLTSDDTLGAARAIASLEAVLAGVTDIRLDAALVHTASRADATEDTSLADLGFDLITSTLTPAKARAYIDHIDREAHAKRCLRAALVEYVEGQP